MTPAQQITRHYRGNWQGNQGLIPTPGHSPDDRGTSVKDAKNGEVVFYCHNGDQTLWQPLKDECRRLGLLPERERPQGGSWRETGRYEYVDADGIVAYRTVRIEQDGRPKKFRAQRPGASGGWIDGLGDTPRILYRFPDVIAADPTTFVYLTEGERKADKLTAWGFTATAIAFGANGWRDCYAQALSGRTVIILPESGWCASPGCPWGAAMASPPCSRACPLGAQDRSGVRP